MRFACRGWCSPDASGGLVRNDGTINGVHTARLRGENLALPRSDGMLGSGVARCAPAAGAAGHPQQLERVDQSSYLLPDMRWGYGYLRAVRNVFGGQR